MKVLSRQRFLQLLPTALSQEVPALSEDPRLRGVK